MKLNELKKRVAQICAENEQIILELANYIYNNPELGFQEKKACKKFSNILKSKGFLVKTGIASMETSFVAELSCKKTKPCIAFLAEYDALPGLGHACGHNLIGAASVGAAIGLTEVMEELDGTLLVFGCPAEEGLVDNAGGKEILIRHKYFDNVDAALMFHPANETKYNYTSSARKALEISFYGKSAHAAGAPEHGINALDAAINSFVGWNALRQHLPEGVRIHGIISDGGKSPNTVPDFAQIKMYVRAKTDELLDVVLEKVKNCARGAAQAAGADVEFRNTAYRYKSFKPNELIASVFEKNLELEEKEEGSTSDYMGSTDMGNVSNIVPSIHPKVAICTQDIVSHSPEFRDATTSLRSKEILLAVTKALALTALEMLYSPALIENAWSEFKQSR